MSRAVYTYTDLKKLHTGKNFQELMRWPIITVSADLRKCLNGSAQTDKVEGVMAHDPNFRVTEFHTLVNAIDHVWNTDQSKFQEMILLSELLRGKMRQAAQQGDDRTCNWLTGCMRNLDSLLSAILLLEQAGVEPEELSPGENRNLGLLVEAWELLLKKDKALAGFRKKMEMLRHKEAWQEVFRNVFHTENVGDMDTLVFHGFYYITPQQERVMRLLETAGFRLVFLIHYDERFPYVFEIWEQTYTQEKGFEPKSRWHTEGASSQDPYGEMFEGENVRISNKLEIKEYGSVMEFVNDVKHIREKGFSLYAADFHTADQLLKEYFPEEYGERRMLSYPIGQFISILNRLWDEEEQAIALEADDLIECFSSGWLSMACPAGGTCSSFSICCRFSKAAVCERNGRAEWNFSGKSKILSLHRLRRSRTRIQRYPDGRKPLTVRLRISVCLPLSRRRRTIFCI